MKKQIRLITGAYGAFVFLISFVVFAVTKRAMHLMFAWNVILAFIPLVLSEILTKVKDKKLLICLVLGLWVLFYPNTFYLLTDFVHLRQDWFYVNDVRSPVYSIVNWLSFFHILFLGILGVLLGGVSYLWVEEQLDQKIGLRKGVLLLRGIISALTACAIYIGRFLRFNSWDVLKPVSLLKDLSHSVSWFFVFFILMFTILIFGTLSFFSMVYRKKGAE